MKDGNFFLSVNNFSAQLHASSKSRHNLNFRVMEICDIELFSNVFGKKYSRFSHVIETKNRNNSMNKVKNLRYDR